MRSSTDLSHAPVLIETILYCLRFLLKMLKYKVIVVNMFSYASELQLHPLPFLITRIAFIQVIYGQVLKVVLLKSGRGNP